MVTNRGFSTNRGDNRSTKDFCQRTLSKTLTSIVDLDNRQTIESLKNAANRSQLCIDDKSNLRDLGIKISEYATYDEHIGKVIK